MIDNFLSAAKIARSPASPIAYDLAARAVQANGLATRSTAITSQARRDYFRSVSASVPIMKEHGISWEMGLGDGLGFLPLLDALADPGTYTGGPPYTWRIGRASDVVRYDFGISPVEGGYYEIRDAAVVSAQILMERRSLIRIISDWAGRSFSTVDRIGDVAAGNSTSFATDGTTFATFGDYTVKVHSGSLAFSREIRPANFDEAGVATAWDGVLAVDIIGRLLCRLSSADFVGLLANTPTEKALVLQYFFGGWKLTVSIPRCICEASERLVIYRGTYEHVIDFAVVRGGTANLATIALETA